MANESQHVVIGSGTMGKIFAGEEAVSLRNTEDFEAILVGKDIVVLAGRQTAGLKWLRKNKELLSGKIVISVMAFTDFETLETAVDNDEVKFVRIMTNTGLSDISHSDDGRLNEEEKAMVGDYLTSKSDEVVYLGERNDLGIDEETMKACYLGWTAQALAEITGLFGEEVLVRVLQQRQDGVEFAAIAQKVATAGGATEAGINTSTGKFRAVAGEQLQAGLIKAKEKQIALLEFAQNNL